MYKLVFFDLDGTLLNDKKEILKENVEEIKRIEKLGKKAVICSGRQANAIKQYKNILQTSQYIICTNGAEILDSESNNHLYLSEINNKDVHDLYELVQTLNLIVKIDTPNYRYINNINYASLEEIPFENNLDNLIKNDKIIQISLGH